MATPQEQDFRHSTRIMLRPVASGLPLGFFAFGIGMLMLGLSAIGVIPLLEMKQIGLILAAFVFPLELIATIFAFLARDTSSATTLGLFTTSWLTLGIADIISKPGDTSIAIGIYLFGFAVAAIFIALLAIKAKPFISALLAFAFARMVLDGIYEVGGGIGSYRVSGYVALCLTALAFYGAVAFILEDMGQREVFPLFRRAGAKAAFEGYDSQLERLEAEPGVRHQL